MTNTNLREKITESAFEYLVNKVDEHQIILFEKETGDIGLFDLSESSNTHSVEFSLSSFLEIKDQLKNKVVYSAHNHPSGHQEPSTSDRFALLELNSLLRLNGITLIEELIVTANGVNGFILNENDFIYQEHFQEHSKNSTKLTKTPIASYALQVHTKVEMEKMIKKHLLKGDEVAIAHGRMHFSNSFTFSECLTITNNLENVVIWGFPRYQDSTSFEKIRDMNTTFGAIECYSLDETNQLIPLKLNRML